MRKILSLMAATALSACAVNQEAPVATAPTPYPPSAIAAGAVTGPSDADTISAGLVELVAARLPPGATGGQLRVEPPEAGDLLLGPALVDALRRNGYAAEIGASGAGPTFTYRVGPLDTGVVARATVDGKLHAARAFARTKGGLRPLGTGTVMQMGGL